MKRKMDRIIIWVLVLSLVCLLFHYLDQNKKAGNLIPYSEESEQFRQMELSVNLLRRMKELEKETGYSIGEQIAVFLPVFRFQMRGHEEEMTAQTLETWDLFYTKRKKGIFSNLKQSCRAIWDDLECFPIQNGEKKMVFENSWMFARTYGGERGHEGTDLMPPENVRDYYRVVSMTDGVVEKIGWLEKGGWRIGIRSEHEGYFYYAHLSSYAEEFAVGDEVKAGDLLGYMGDTGYGTKENTMGKFDVHLHLGIYIQTERMEEMSINPYWILRFLADKNEI